MKKTIFHGIVSIVTFLAALVIISNLLNQGNTDMTEEMRPASLPLIYMNVDGERVNCLHGYQELPQLSYLRESITPLGDGRTLSFDVQKYGRNISQIFFEVRSVDGSRLVEDGRLTEYTEIGDEIHAEFAIKDLIEAQKEYSLILKLQIDTEQEISYTTHIILATDYHAEEKIAFARDFSARTFDREEAQEIVKYLESNSQGDNSSFGVVNIHSSFNQITWGSLGVKKETEPVFTLRELASQTASVTGSYIVSVLEGKQKHYYRVEEFYRLRYTVDRIYLLDFERTMTQIFDEKNTSAYVGNRIVLGIQEEPPVLVESDGGNVFAFVDDKGLYSYNVSEQKMAVLYTFRDDSFDARCMYDAHNMKILSVDETGNVRFVVYGYMNRGLHEGQIGIMICYYNSLLNTVEEEIYIPYDKSYEILEAEMSMLSYVSRTNVFYFILNGDIYAVSLDSRSYEIIAQNLEVGRFQVSPDQSFLVWQEGKNADASTSLVHMNLNTQMRRKIDAGIGNYIKPIGFMGSDLIYGVAHSGDVYTDSYGISTFPMYEVMIVDENGTVLKEYSNEGIYVTGGQITDNQLNMSRVIKNEDGSYRETGDDQIINNIEQKSGINTLERPVTEKYETIVQIVVKNTIDNKALQILTPKEVLFEGSRTLAVTEDTEMERFFVYAKDGVIGMYNHAADAINLAYAQMGVVVDDTGHYIWVRGNRRTRNQIMAISAESVSETRGSTAVCLDTLLAYEGVARNSQYLLDEGETVLQILREALEGCRILDLSECSLDAILYYVNRDIPVLALMGDNTVLIVGYNDSQIAIMDPKSNSIYKKSFSEADEWFRTNGAVFISYLEEQE
ncbi:MAG: hypothetical protein HDQ98_11045 [Lachnospiraceae bacterium]|nr:hypothetical protein [Lachnospiraceae bacterium]